MGAAASAAAAWAALARMGLAERYPASAALVLSYADSGIALSALSLLGLGLKYSERGRAIYEQLGDLWGRGHAIHHRGICLFIGSGFREAIEALREAIPLLERTGDQYDLLESLGHIGHSHYRLGELREAEAIGRHIYQTGAERDQLIAFAGGVVIWAKASSGNVPAEVPARLGPGRAEERERKRTLRRARRAVRHALFVSLRFRNHRPHALREAGLLAAMEGDLRTAHRRLAQSLAIAEEQGARYERAQTLLARARLGLPLGWPGAARDEAEALAKLAALGQLGAGIQVSGRGLPASPISIVLLAFPTTITTIKSTVPWGPGEVCSSDIAPCQQSACSPAGSGEDRL